MGLLAPGILRVGDIPHLLALNLPRKITVAGSVSLQGARLNAREVEAAFAFTSQSAKAVAGSRFAAGADAPSAQLLAE